MFWGMGLQATAGSAAVWSTARVAEISFGVVEPPVVAQRDITVRAPMSNQQFEERALECSGIAWVDGHLILCSDRHSHILFTCPVDLDQMIIGEPVPHVVIRNEQELLEDAECITTTGRGFVYAMGSLSNDPGGLPLPKRRHMLRFRLTDIEPFVARQVAVLSADTIRSAVNGHLEACGVEPYYTFHAEPDGSGRNTYRWGNVEGMCPTPDGSALLLGMRNPLCGDQAILAAVQGIAEAFGAGDPARFQVTDVFCLDLGGRGVSDLCWDPVTGGYLIVAALSNGPRLSRDQPFPPNTLDSALFWWSGAKKDPAILFARMPDLKIEAVCRLGDTPFIAVGSDEGDLSESRDRQQQSVLTILAFTGVDPRSANR